MGTKRLLFWAGLICIWFSLAVSGQATCAIGSGISVQLVDVERPSNLYQFMYPCQVWPKTASGTILPWVTYPEYDSDTNTFWLMTYYSLEKVHWGGTCPSAGTEVIAVCDYAENSGTLTQKAYYAARLIVVSTKFAVGTATGVLEVPHVTLSQAVPGTIDITWEAIPANTAVAGYRLVRSADGLTNWTTVGDTTNLTLSDAPGAGTWHYALEIRYQGTPDTHVSNHGLSASITVQ